MHRPGPALDVDDNRSATVHQGKWRAENTVKTANGNELVDGLKVATKAKGTYLTEEAHCRSSRKNRVQRKASLLRSYRQWCLRQGSKSLWLTCNCDADGFRVAEKGTAMEISN